MLGHLLALAYTLGRNGKRANLSDSGWTPSCRTHVVVAPGVARLSRESGAEDLPALEPVLVYLRTALLGGPQAAAESAEL